MPALISSYSTNAPAYTTRPTVELEYYKTTPERNSSITLNWLEEIGINARIHKLLKEFSKLNDNWDGDDAIAPTPIVLKKAQFITTLLEKHGQPIYHATPGPNGEIMLDIRNSRKTKSLELIFYPSKSIAVRFPDNGDPSQMNFDYSNLPELLEWINN